MAINSTSSAAEIVAEYVDNADYEIVSSVAKAKLFVHACQALLVKRPSSLSVDGTSTQFRPELIERQMRSARRFILANDTARKKRGGASRAWTMRYLRE